MTLDLTKDVPRSPFATLNGFVWLPRMIDKARAFYAGTMGDYSAYPCPGDKQFLDFFGIDAQAIGTIIKDGASDETITEYVAKQTSRTAADKQAYALRQQNPPASLLHRVALKVFRRKHRAKFQTLHPNLPFGRIDSFAKMIALEEGHPILGL
ncbi:MAG: DUF5069 domain-containing protein [Candidatus Sericytochromatia bacterium]|nr:DUF5069 domain-containing protein [Candidatus Sericytochromatia bacterium]